MSKKVFSFRAEFPQDVEVFRTECTKRSITFDATIHHDPVIPDVCVELSTEADQETLLTVLRGIEDSHVILQTLEELPLKDNPCKRDYDRQ